MCLIGCWFVLSLIVGLIDWWFGRLMCLFQSFVLFVCLFGVSLFVCLFGCVRPVCRCVCLIGYRCVCLFVCGWLCGCVFGFVLFVCLRVRRFV